jgi:hypothetical protein
LPPSAWASTKRMPRIFFKDVASASLCAARAMTTSTSTPKAALSGAEMSGLRWMCLKNWRLPLLWKDNFSGGSVSQSSSPNTLLVNYTGRWLLGTLADEIPSSHSIIYHLLLKQSKRWNEVYFERVGLFVKTVPAGVEHSRGQVSTAKII